jgi:ribosomal protein S18 acetylase RimI-like enzyme
MGINIRKATQKDCEFISQIILLAESTGFEVTSYEKMFNMSREELLVKLTSIVNNESTGHPLCFDSFYLAEVDGVRAAGLSAYVEGLNGKSNHLMTGALMSEFDRETLQSGFNFLAKHKEIQIAKTNKTLQLDCIATMPKHFGKGLFSKLLNHIEVEHFSKNIECIEIQVWKLNKKAVSIYKAKDYSITAVHDSYSFKGNGKILMQKRK